MVGEYLTGLPTGGSIGMGMASQWIYCDSSISVKSGVLVTGRGLRMIHSGNDDGWEIDLGRRLLVGGFCLAISGYQVGEMVMMVRFPRLFFISSIRKEC